MSEQKCEYFEWPYPDIFNNRERYGRKLNGYPGVEVCITEDKLLSIGACADVYEPHFIEAEFPIKYCPMCGREL